MMAAMERLELLIPDEVKGIEFTVENVPTVTRTTSGVPLGRLIPSEPGGAPRVVVYRRPLEARASGADELRDLVFDVVIEQIGHYLGRRPEEIDPQYGGEERNTGYGG
jgi:predicted Zn-dependent protease with MMP-like domain